MSPETRHKILALEKTGLYGKERITKKAVIRRPI